MKNSSLLVLAITGSVAGGAGFFIRPEEHAFEKYSVLIGAALILIVFHFLTMRHLLKNENRDQQMRIFWIIVIICLPLIGDVLYLIINEAIKRQQQPKPAWNF